MGIFSDMWNADMWNAKKAMEEQADRQKGLNTMGAANYPQCYGIDPNLGVATTTGGVTGGLITGGLITGGLTGQNISQITQQVDLQLQYLPQQYFPQYMAEPVKHITDIPEETVVAAVVAWRAWQVSPFTDELKSFNGTTWMPYEWLKAKCSATTCAGIGCSCGIYCMKKPEHLAEEGYGFSPGQRYKKVYGEVYLKGHILQCTRGYRASHAYPKSFVDTGVLARRMAQVFGAALIPADLDGKPMKTLTDKIADKFDKLLDQGVHMKP